MPPVTPPSEFDTSFMWRPKRIYIPAWQFSGLDYETTTATDVKSIGAGSGNDMTIGEVNSSNITGLFMGANGDTVEHLMAVPGDMDLKYPIYFRVWWTANNTSGSVLWKVFYKTHIANSTVIGTGTAATIAPIQTFHYKGEDYELPPVEGREISNKLKARYFDIRSGKAEDVFGWLHTVPVDVFQV